ncbi:DUF4185 domain-containing protein [Cohnella zeiphila]|uniref:DUF4185 domain-containing protein n=1 Tax=Cohnella zeiphila TaxID=2761120 RepID=A0A7X0SMP7_9BACL|nr:DUF4185 domain-containing protein [Cohnella zeiphila]MBB6730593.1 DUF4185 domain-containing protein [Cohnella zeiphila]
MNDPKLQMPLRKGDPLPAQRLRGADGGDWDFYDFGASYPLESVRWEFEPTEDESGRMRIEGSLDGRTWLPWTAEVSGAGAVRSPIRYVRIAGAAEREPAFLAGTGLAAEPADEWTQLFHRREGWSGSDGIYSIPLNGVEAPGRAASSRTLFLFGDTFVGSVDRQTDERVGYAMINNSMALLDGDLPDPARISFRWGERDGKPAGAILPATPLARSHEGTYYWLQDGTSVGGKFHCFPLIVGPNPDGPEGFEFTVHGVAMVSAPMGEDGPELARQEQADTPLYFRSANGHTTYFGAAILPLTEEAGVPNPDGYVYIYGLQQNGGTKLVVARVPAGELERTDRWTFWNGSAWTGRKEECEPVAPETSTELSVTPLSGGWLDGKFALVFQQGGIHGNRVAASIGESPVGPFGPAIPLFYCSEPEAGNGIYTYNAKAHPHLSRPGELLASYNVNTTSWEAHRLHGGIYRPRFIRIRQIV